MEDDQHDFSPENPSRPTIPDDAKRVTAAAKVAISNDAAQAIQAAIGPKITISEDAKRALATAIGPQVRITEDAAQAIRAAVAPTIKITGAANALRDIGIAANATASSQLAQTVKLATENMKGITELSSMAGRLELGLASIEFPTEVFAAKAKREADRDAAILATRDATVELAGGIRELAAVEAEILVQLTRMAADSQAQTETARNTHRWTKASAWVGIAVLLITAAALGFAVATYLYG
jgi:hypothetical protein